MLTHRLLPEVHAVSLSTLVFDRSVASASFHSGRHFVSMFLVFPGKRSTVKRRGVKASLGLANDFPAEDKNINAIITRLMENYNRNR